MHQALQQRGKWGRVRVSRATLVEPAHHEHRHAAWAAARTTGRTHDDSNPPRP